VTTPTPARARRDARQAEIVAVARRIAEADGWPGVTVRRLADAIGYSQPVLYGHFPDGRDGIVRAVALEGFELMAATLPRPSPRASRRTRVDRLVRGYLRFALDYPAVYEAMFVLPIGLPFGTSEAPESLHASFAAVLHAVGDDGPDPETRAEVLWSAMHGLAELARHGRLRPDHENARIRLLVDLFA
jgi:AcrR family transcriptional regulator